jgi:hypothetical protein
MEQQLKNAPASRKRKPKKPNVDKRVKKLMSKSTRKKSFMSNLNKPSPTLSRISKDLKMKKNKLQRP